MKKLLRKIDLDHLKVLSETKGVQTFENDVDVFKNNEVPSAALIVLEGEADILKKEEEFLQVSPGYALGLNELKERSPSSLHLRAKRNLKAIILSRFDFSEDSPLCPLLEQLMS